MTKYYLPDNKQRLFSDVKYNGFNIEMDIFFTGCADEAGDEVVLGAKVHDYIEKFDWKVVELDVDKYFNMDTSKIDEALDIAFELLDCENKTPAFYIVGNCQC